MSNDYVTEEILDLCVKTLIEFEDLHLEAYRDIAGVWTIGIGQTRTSTGKKIQQGDVITEEEAVRWCQAYVTTIINCLDEISGLNKNQVAALVSFIYNIGTADFRMSTLRTKLISADYAGAADQFLRWDKYTDPKTGIKKVSKGLAARRKKERALFLTPVREKIHHSTTLQAAAMQVSTAVAGGAGIIPQLDGHAQIVAIAAVVVIVLSAAWIARERIQRFLRDA